MMQAILQAKQEKTKTSAVGTWKARGDICKEMSVQLKDNKVRLAAKVILSNSF